LIFFGFDRKKFRKMSGSIFSNSLRIIINLVNIFSILYPIYVFYYFLTKTGGYYQGKLPENGEELLRSYVEHPLMAISKS
jgi:hypothetical protein